MRKVTTLLAAAVLLAWAGWLPAAPVKSGPQPGERMPGSFRPLHITGPDAGKRVCLYCKYAARPVALVFARELTPAVADLLARIDAATTARRDAGLASFTVFLGNTDKLTGPVKQLAASHNIRQNILTVDESAPERYGIAADAAVTVILYRRHKVAANHAFRTGELDAGGTAAVLADLDQMLSR